MSKGEKVRKKECNHKKKWKRRQMKQVAHFESRIASEMIDDKRRIKRLPFHSGNSSPDNDYGFFFLFLFNPEDNKLYFCSFTILNSPSPLPSFASFLSFLIVIKYFASLFYYSQFFSSLGSCVSHNQLISCERDGI